ncbi:hypothetical protein [Tamlana crocina]|uniref:Uncharacterized protein n=1 Tax=Tamlana crocina TaxID=393006 RepID=A0ABX1DH11_9FLAO|nr:hypothetical protein [Tamlana crocina]NJX16293.1 hypothetical protein [Tamlana crocina]
MIITGSFVILLAIVFILVWLFMNTVDHRKWLTFLVSLVLAPIIYFYVFYPLLNIFSSYHHQKHFNAKAWKESPALRYEMSHEILNDSLFIGKNKIEVTQLLGESEWYGWDDALKVYSPNKWNYNMGLKPGAFNNMQECLELQFEDNNVESVRLYQLERTFE